MLRVARGRHVMGQIRRLFLEGFKISKMFNKKVKFHNNKYILLILLFIKISVYLSFYRLFVKKIYFLYSCIKLDSFFEITLQDFVNEKITL